MTIVDITGYLTDDICVVLKRNTDNGYVTLKPFLPILDQLNDYSNINPTLSDSESDSFTIDSTRLHKYYNDDMNSIDSSKENSLLTKFGVLVDTDSNGYKWITGEKAIQILKRANIYDLFKDKLNSSRNRTGLVKNSHSSSSSSSSSSSNKNNGNTITTPTIADSTTSKRNTDSFSQMVDPQRQLGSPLKKNESK